MSAAVDHAATRPPPPEAREAGARQEKTDTRRSPAPAGDYRTDVPSARPTSAPPFDLASFADSRMAFGSASDVPLDRMVVERVATPLAFAELDHRTSFVLLHVDGVSTVAGIATLAQLPLAEVIGCVLELLAIGLVRTHAPDPVSQAPTSGVFAKAQPR